MSIRLIVTTLIVVVASVSTSTAKTHLILAADGRTLVQPLPITDGAGRISIQTRSAPADWCLEKRPEAGDLVVKYRFVQEPQQPFALSVDDKTAIPDGNEFTIPVDKVAAGSKFVIVNLWESSATAEQVPERQKCVARLRTTAESMAPLQKFVKDAESDVEKWTQIVEKTQREIGAFVEAAKVFQGNVSDVAAQEVIAILRKTETLRTRLTTEQDEAKKANARLSKAKADLVRASTNTAGFPDELTARADRLSNYIAAKTGDPRYTEALVLKVGGLFVGRNMKSVTYDLQDRGSSDAIAMSPMGSYPVVHYGDRLHAVLTNVLDEKFPGPFALFATAQAGTVINIEPVRPVFEPGKVRAGEASLERPSTVELSDNVYRDVVLPVTGTFAPNEFAEVTIETQRAGADGKPAKVSLLDKAKFPPFRALYRFNFNSGVVRSGLRAHTFQKVRTVDDDSATDKINEARYRILDSEDEPRVMPMFGFSVSFIGVDIQSPPTWAERFTPSLTLGFAFTNPANDVFVGFSHEVIRNLQFFWGVHFGLVNELLNRNDISEDHDATQPTTRSRRERAMTYGLTFNANVVAKIFK